MKKVSEMNGTEKIAWRNIKAVFDWEVGGWYNCLQDNCPECIPDSLEEAKDAIYWGAINDYSSKGIYRTGKAPREMRFAGEQFIRECIDCLFAKDDDALAVAEEKNWN